jgi:hypothetical protein
MKLKQFVSQMYCASPESPCQFTSQRRKIMQATHVQSREPSPVRPDPHLVESRRLRRQWAHDPSARLLLDADSAIRLIARAIAAFFGR